MFKYKYHLSPSFSLLNHPSIHSHEHLHVCISKYVDGQALNLSVHLCEISHHVNLYSTRNFCVGKSHGLFPKGHFCSVEQLLTYSGVTKYLLFSLQRSALLLGRQLMYIALYLLQNASNSSPTYTLWNRGFDEMESHAELVTSCSSHFLVNVADIINYKILGAWIFSFKVKISSRYKKFQQGGFMKEFQKDDNKFCSSCGYITYWIVCYVIIWWNIRK